MVVEREVDDREPGAMIRVRFAPVPEVLAPGTIRKARVYRYSTLRYTLKVIGSPLIKSRTLPDSSAPTRSLPRGIFSCTRSLHGSSWRILEAELEDDALAGLGLFEPLAPRIDLQPSNPGTALGTWYLQKNPVTV